MCTARASERGCSCENRNILGTHRATGGILPLLLILSVETLCYPHSPILFCASAKTIGTMHFALCQSHSLFLTLFCMSPFLIINYAVLELNFVQTMCLYFYFLLHQMYDLFAIKIFIPTSDQTSLFPRFRLCPLSPLGWKSWISLQYSINLTSFGNTRNLRIPLSLMHKRYLNGDLNLC